jgi:hypothetical protein
MDRVVIAAISRALAAGVLLAAALGATWAAMFKVSHPVWGMGIRAVGVSVPACSPGIPCVTTSPGWTIPVAVAIGLAGVVAAVLLHRPRPVSAAGLR